MNTEVMFSSKTDEWETPQWLFNELNKEFNFELDVCCGEYNCKCEIGYMKDENGGGLAKKWFGNCWMNPPYGRGIGKWVQKAYEESLNGCSVVCLLPARTDTKWFHDYCVKGEVRFLKGRLLFKKNGNEPNKSERAPFPSMVVIFKAESEIKTA